MKTNVARFVTRLQGKGDGLIMGSLLKEGEGLLKPNSVYNLYKCHLTGDLILKFIGESCIEDLGFNWGMEYSTILTRCSPEIFLSSEELKELLNEHS